MKKSTFLIITISALIGCAIFESSPTYSTEAVKRAELGLSETTTSPNFYRDATDQEIHDKLKKVYPHKTSEEIEDIIFGKIKQY